jgi:hypothetical protein
MSSEQGPPDQPKPSTKAAERLAVIVDAAERAALEVIDDAEKEARRYLDEAEARADLIVAQKLHQAAEELERRAGTSPEPRLRPVVAPAPPAPPSEPPAAPSRPDADEDRPSGPDPANEGQAGSAAARLLATQMAVSGSSREEIETRLRNGFDIEDTGEILDAILGPED